MDQLPAEILTQIFLQLHHDQKSKCMRVCRRWKHIIGTSYLFHTMRISTDMSMLKLLESVNANPEIGAEVERLVCNCFILEKHYLDMFLLFFPHLRVACFLNCNTDDDLKIKKNHPWTENLEILLEKNSDAMAKQLLGSGICFRLKTLVIKAAGNDGGCLTGISSLLVNAPVLNTLILKSYTFTLNDLNTLSSALPHLESISFISCRLLSTKLSSAPIEPATSVISFSIHELVIEAHPLETEAEFLVYVSKKYPSLSRIVYVDNRDYFHMPTEVNNRYRTAWLAIFIALKSRLKTLKFQRMEIGLNVCGLLDIADCRVQKLHVHSKRLYPLYENLLSSHQTNSIRKLTIEVQEFNTTGYQWLKGLNLLRKLKWIIQRYPHNPFSLNELIKVLPDSLEALSLKSAQKNSYTFDFNSLAPTRSLSIKSVSFCNITINNDIEKFLTNNLPSLIRLKLHRCRMDTPSLSLPNTRFSFLKISCDFESMYRNVILSTEINNETRLYAAKCESMMGNQFKYLFGALDTPMYPSVICSPTAEFDFEPYIRINCYAVQDLVIIDHF